MTDPHSVLGLGPGAGESEIRDRYLQLVREFPPDRAPERFAEIRAAYDRLRDPLVHLERQLFVTSTQDSFDAMAAELRTRLALTRLPVEGLLRLADQ